MSKQVTTASAALPQPPPAVLVVILTWNGKDDTLKSCDSVLQSTYPHFDLLVVDNASEDQTVEALRQRFGDEIRIHRNSRNLMFAGGMNVGLRIGMSGEYDFVLILNNDVEIEAGMLQELVCAALADDTTAAVGPKIYYMQPRDQIWFAGGSLNLWKGWSRHRGIRQLDQGQFDDAVEADYLTGCAILFRSSALEKVGLLDTGFHMYAEDADWAFRARKAGFRLKYVPSARMWHRVSGTAGLRSAFKIRNRVKSQMRFLLKHGRWYHWATVPFFSLYEAVRATWAVVRNRL